MGTSSLLHQDPNSVQRISEHSDLDLYTIPISSGWFRWEDIHEKEKVALKEFFEGTSLTRTPKIYKEYRDFIINKFREDSSKRLTFSEARKHLVGDVSLLLKVFRFLEDNGLINFGLSLRQDTEEEEEDGVRVECGPPSGVRITGVDGLGGFRSSLVQPSRRPLPAPLASYGDVYGELVRKDFVPARCPACGHCGASCDSVRYQSSKDDFVICGTCFEKEDYGETRNKDDFKVVDGQENDLRGADWSDEETLLLLESVLRHGDDWDAVVKDVPTKSKIDCITKLIEVPFGDLLLPSSTATPTSIKADVLPLSVSKETSVDDENFLRGEQGGDDKTLDECPPTKKHRSDFLLDDNSLMEKVIRMSTMVESEITSAAANAAIDGICDEIACPRDIFERDEVFAMGNSSSCLFERHNDGKDAETNGKTSLSDDQGNLQDGVPLALRLRAAVATSLGAAAAHAKVLAVKEQSEMENLMTVLLETQLKKLEGKMKGFVALEALMEKEYAELDVLKQSLIEERMLVLHDTIANSVTKSKP